MKRYIAVIELDDEEEIVGDANISYTYRSNGTNYGTDESVELKAEGEGQRMKTYEDGLNEAWEAARTIVDCKVPYDFWELPSGQSMLAVLRHYSAKGAIEKIREYEEEQKEPVFKIGDRVRTLVDKDNLGTEIFPTGTIGEVVGINGDSIAVEAYTTTGYGYYRTDALELANDVFLVGDEVYLLDKNYRGVVTAVWEHCGVKVETLTQSGKLSCTDAKDLHRTGRRFPEIVNILKQMQEGEA